MDFLVKLSRRTRVMVPLVVLVGATLFGASYMIRDQQIVSRQETANDASPVQEGQTPQLDPVDGGEQEQEPVLNPEDPVSGGSVDPGAPDGQPLTETVTVNVLVSGTTVTAELSTDKPGKCTLMLDSEQGGSSSMPTASHDKTCVFKDVETGGTITVMYVSDDGTAKGVGQAQ